MVYPNGETVATSYNTQGLPVTLTGSDAYVTNAAYNAQGQMTQLVRGGNAVATAYDYFDAAGNFRLEAIRHGATNDALPDFSYQYDAVGNITQMTAVTGSDTDSQSFSYDALNRLLTASAGAASPAPYSESYEYDALGNILSRNGASYSYTPAASRTYTHTQPHAVTGIGSDQSFNYDANGNMTFRQEETGSFSQAWDVENRLITVTNTANGDVTSFAYDAGGQRVKTVKPDGKTIHTPFPNYEVELWPDSLLPPPVVSLTANGQSGLVIIPAWRSFTLAWDSDYADSCTASGSWSGSKGTSGSQVMAGFGKYARTYTLTCANANGAASQSVTVQVSGIDPPPCGFLCAAGSIPALTAPAPAALAAGDGLTPIITRVTYLLAGQPIAVRVSGDPGGSNGLFYLHADHLGSTTAMSDASGNLVGDVTRYLPFGGYRGSSGPNPITDHAYTGQRENMEIGLYYYNARYYAPYLNRFISADTLVPDPANPQSFNRYSYVENRPLNFNDPTGHSCVDALEGYPAEEYDCLAEGISPLVFYLNGLGGEENYPRIEDANNEYIVLLYVLSLMAGEENVVHIPLFTKPGGIWKQRLDMVGEALGIAADQTQFAADMISQYLAENPLQPEQQLVLVGSSAGGTVAIEVLDLLEEKGIFVDQVILRGSPVHELSLGNVGRVDYIAADPPSSDWYYSVDINPFDGVTVNEHSIPGFIGHQPQTARQLRQIAGMVVDLIIDASTAR